MFFQCPSSVLGPYWAPCGRPQIQGRVLLTLFFIMFTVARKVKRTRLDGPSPASFWADGLPHGHQSDAQGCFWAQCGCVPGASGRVLLTFLSVLFTVARKIKRTRLDGPASASFWADGLPHGRQSDAQGRALPLLGCPRATFECHGPTFSCTSIRSLHIAV